jgi:rsbT co-antagonist protein RsbR
VTRQPGAALGDILQHEQASLLADWLREQKSASTRRDDLMSDAEVGRESKAFLAAFAEAWRGGDYTTAGAAWAPLRGQLGDLSRSRTLQGFTPSEIATFVLSFKQPIFTRLRGQLRDWPDQLADELWLATTVLDKLGLYTTEIYRKSREEVIARQQNEMLELSTPVIKLWDGILALPMIGTLDSNRTQVVMESLLQRIVESESDTAILDITGVPTVDTLVAQHLIKTVTAARLMGADCIISGIRPQIAQTIVHLGVDLRDIVTKASLADAFAIALSRRNLQVQPVAEPGGARE